MRDHSHHYYLIYLCLVFNVSSPVSDYHYAILFLGEVKGSDLIYLLQSGKLHRAIDIHYSSQLPQ